MATTTGRTRWLLERLGARHGGDRFPARYHLPAPQASGSANLPHERPANPRALPYAASLIANLELKFPVSRTKQAKSNRKKMRVLRAPWRIEMPRSVPSSRVSKILIVTKRAFHVQTSRAPPGGQRYERQVQKSRQDAGTTRREGRQKKRRRELHGALRLRQRGCGIDLWTRGERLRCS
jgi:hypothetical protein